MDKSRLPSWLRDSKKATILGIVLLCMIASSFNTTRLTIRYADRISNRLFGFEISRALSGHYIMNSVFNTINGIHNGENGLTGEWENINADETLVLGSGGVFTYKSGDSEEKGNWTLEDGYLTLSLDSGWSMTLYVSEQTKDKLVLFDGSMYYQYEK